MTADHAINLVLLLSKYLHGSQLEEDFFFWRRKGQDPWPGRKAAGWGWISFNEAISGKHAAELRLRREYNVSLFCPLFLFFFFLSRRDSIDSFCQRLFFNESGYTPKKILTASRLQVSYILLASFFFSPLDYRQTGRHDEAIKKVGKFPTAATRPDQTSSRQIIHQRGFPQPSLTNPKPPILTPPAGAGGAILIIWGRE